MGERIIAKATVTLTFNVEEDLPESWNDNEIESYFKDNYGSYIDMGEPNDIEVEIDEIEEARYEPEYDPCLMEEYADFYNGEE